MQARTILVIDACVRQEDSRTRQLKEAFLSAFSDDESQWHIKEVNLERLDLRPLNRERLFEREALCDRHDFASPMFQCVHDLLHADILVIAAPYWDLSFPASVKVWIEHMFVRNLTFYYSDDKPHGLLHATNCIYLTTSGSRIGGNNWGADYIQAAMSMLGIRNCSSISAEGLDLECADVDGIMNRAKTEAYALACKIRD